MALTFALPPLSLSTLSTDAEYAFLDADSPNWLGVSEESSSWERSSSPDSFDISEDLWGTPEPAPVNYIVSPLPSPRRLISPLSTPKAATPQAYYFDFFETPTPQQSSVYPSSVNSFTNSPLPSPLSNPFAQSFQSPFVPPQFASPAPLQFLQPLAPPKRAPKKQQKAPAQKKAAPARKTKENKLKSALAWAPSTSNSSDPDNQVLIGRYTQKERRSRIASYLQKRLQRSLAKKVIYGCRKVFADARPRVGGRFVKLTDMDAWNSSQSSPQPTPVVE